MGCSSSSYGTPVVQSKRVSSDQIQAASSEKSISQPTRFLENCLIIWLCEETSTKFENGKEQLRKLIYGLKIYNNVAACISFINDIQDEKVFLIISDTHRFIEQFHHLPQLEKIYIFNPSSRELNDEKDVIIRDIDSLYQQLQEDMKMCEIDYTLITIVPVPSQEISFSSSLSKQEASFLFAQMIKEILYRLKFESGSKDVLIDFCRVHYINNEEQLRVINDFAKTYRPNKVLRWLTQPCFISKILNRVQRTREVDIIYKLGFLIKQAHIQLTRLHEENLSLMKHIHVVYRGKTMPCNDFDTLVKNNFNGLLSFSNFLIATTKKDVSIDFVCHRLAMHPDMTGIVFEIHINGIICNQSNPFALLKDVDMDMDEVCFHIGTVFRIESMEEITNRSTRIWFVKLKPINDNDPQLLYLAAPARSDDMHANPILYLSKLLIDMGEYRRAEQVFQSLLQDTSVRSQPRRLVRVHNGLGALYTFKNEYAKALDHYQQALQTSLIYLHSDHPDLAPIYIKIADNHSNQNDYVHAKENYEKAIESLQHDTQQNNSELITDLYNRVNDARQSIEKNK
jgi:hypothetical protein